MTLPSTTEPAPVPSPSPGAPAAATWQAGTLNYTKRGLGRLFGWMLCGDFAWTIKERAYAQTLPQVMLRSFGAPDWLVGLLVFSLPQAISLLLIPIASVKSDRHRGPRGRRTPFLIVFVPIAALSMLGLALSPRLGDGLSTLFGLTQGTGRLLAFAAFWLTFEIGTVVVNTIFNALINDVVPTVIIGRFYALFRAVSLCGAVIVNFFLVGEFESHYVGICLGLGVLYGCTMLPMAFRVREGAYPPPAAQLPGFHPIRAVTLYLRECFAHPFYRSYFIASALASLTFWPFNTFAIYHARSVGVGDDFFGKSLAASYVVSFLLAYPIGMLADRFHPLRLVLTALVAELLLMVAGLAFPTSRVSFVAMYMLHTVIAGSYLTSLGSLGPRILPRAKFGQYTSAAGIVNAFFIMLLPPVIGLLVRYNNQNYRCVFAVGVVVATASVIAYLRLLARFRREGGYRNYQPPV